MKKHKQTTKKTMDKIHLGAWKKGATARWKNDYIELNSKIETVEELTKQVRESFGFVLRNEVK